MSFLQPWLLIGLPLVALPIIIHLINQRRYQTVRWAAMMFLLAANRMSRGYARLRQWLILAFRVLVIAALVFAISRPLASGWLGLAAGGRPDTTIVLLDRSPSMQQAGADGGATKLETGRQQLVQTLKTLGANRYVLFESTTGAPRELESPQELLNLPAAEPAGASADLAAMLLAAHDYVKENKAGRTEIWICSDIRQNDWDAESGRWQTFREAFGELPQSVRFHLLAYPQPASGNLSVRVTGVRRQQNGDGAHLLVSLRLSREGEQQPRQSVPVQFDIEGARSQIVLELEGPQYDLKEHSIPIESRQERGWGKVSIPADANAADNEFYFAFDQPQPRKTVIVADDDLAARPLQLAAEISHDLSFECSVEVVASEQLTSVDWGTVSLLLWQAPLPSGDAAAIVREFVERGGNAIFLPPRSPSGDEIFGARWLNWTEAQGGMPIAHWRGDQGLLSHTQSGAALPVGQLLIRRYCALEGELTPLAELQGGATLLARATTNRGGAHFFATTPAPGDSSLAADGVVLYVMVQRALANGAGALGNTRQLMAGEATAEDAAAWQRLAGADGALSDEYRVQQGVYAASEKLLAVNRAAAEDQAPILADDRVADLFRGLDFSRVDDRAGSLASLIQEVWRLFLATMLAAMIVEAALCLPRLVGTSAAASSGLSLSQPR